ncbi:MAG: hypothetical protein JRM73_01740 [Nitrososphaerota archaeon]|nr:hypothetical protein [Nitrososphaerota archaeon]
MHRSRWVSLVALLTALAVVLGGVTVPAPYATFLLYGVWEIPILLALLLLGLSGGTAVALLNALALEAINPGPLPTGPVYNVIAELSMFAGVLAAMKLAKGRGTAVLGVAAVVLGAVARTVVMTVVNYLVLPQPYPIGFSIPQGAVLGFLVPIALFNASVALYVVPVALGIRRAVESRIAPPESVAARS